MKGGGQGEHEHQEEGGVSSGGVRETVPDKHVVQGVVDGKHVLAHGVCHSLCPQGVVQHVDMTFVGGGGHHARPGVQVELNVIE